MSDYKNAQKHEKKSLNFTINRKFNLYRNTKLQKWG